MSAEPCCGSPDPMYFPSINEDGWRCMNCDAALDFRPDLDRSHTFTKVRNLLSDLHTARLLYVSNGTEGDVIAENVAGRCTAENLYDQLSIVRFITEDPNVWDHAPFWANRAERFLLGGEPIRDDQDPLPFGRIPERSAATSGLLAPDVQAKGHS